VNSIRGGDAIQVFPKAQYPGWINFVQEAEIEVYFSKKPLDSLSLGVPKQVATLGTSPSNSKVLYRDFDEAADEFRLVYLNPGNFEEPISCSLAHTSLQGPLRIGYEALSYCWGDPRQRHDISLIVHNPDGVLEYNLSCTLSLHSALKNLRPKTGPSRILWIDSICINQANLDERSRQVSLMRAIYRKAERVIVWLGEGNERTKKSIRTVNTISDRYERYGPLNKDDKNLALLHEPLMKDLNVQAFVDDWPLFELPWFRRTWVVQEIFNAREAIVCCGEDTLTWPTVLRVNKCIPLDGLKMNSAYRALMPPIFDDLFGSRTQTEGGWSAEVGILEVLIKGLDLDATDPRDKIFAMLQFGSETRDPGSLPPDLVPDYSKPAAEVFLRFTKWWIVKHQSLRILSAVQALEGRTWQDHTWGGITKLATEQPTWSWWHRGHSNWAIGLLGLSTECSYRAGADTKPNISIIAECSDLFTLPLSGIRMGVIEKVMPYPYYAPPQNHEALHRAYVGIFDPLNLTGKWNNQLTSKNNHSYVTDESPAAKKGHLYSHLEFSTRTHAVQCHSDCFFRTREGLAGLCPFSAQVGDVVVILYGGPVPYVVRPSTGAKGIVQEPSNKYEFVGECYLQGCMEGRGIEEQEEKGNPSEVFLLV
jgi:hypothetical protein